VGALSFYLTLYKAALKSRAEYRVDFAVGVFTAILMQLAALSFYWVIFLRTPAIGGWSPAHVLFLFGMCAMILGLSEFLANGIWWLPYYVLGGEFDRLLIYPVRSLLFVLLARPELHALGNMGMGAAMVVVSFQMQAPPLLAYALVPLWVVAGAVIYTSLLVVIGCLGFRAMGSSSTQHFMVVHHLLNASRYPANIYPGWLRSLILFICPIGAATFVPGQWLEQRTSLALALLAPPLAAFMSALLASTLWTRALRHYESTGS
jgi:ABC-2 type transport system permease protein